MKETEPLVSVGIPTYNRPEGLKRALESVCSQTYKNLEIIVSDNCSTIENSKISKELSIFDLRIQYFRQNQNIGAENNFNFVLKKSSGKFFMWLGDDDWIDKDYIEKCVYFLIQNIKYILVSGQIEYFVKDKIIYYGNLISIDAEDPYRRVISYYSQVSDNGIFYGVYRKKEIDDLSLREKILGADWLFLAKVAFRGKFATNSKTTIHRYDSGSGNRVYYAKLIERFEIRNYKNLYIKFPHFFISRQAAKEIKNDPVFLRTRSATCYRKGCSLLVFLLLIDKWYIGPVIKKNMIFLKAIGKKIKRK